MTDIFNRRLHSKHHIIWDWNGTLLNDVHHAVGIVNKLLLEENLSLTDLENYKKDFGFPVIEYYKKLGFETSPEKFHDLCERFNNYFYDGLHACELWAGARETLTMVKKAGKVQSLLSATEQNLLLQSLKHFSLEDVFDHVFGIFDKKAHSKVERGHELMKRSSVAKEQTVLIGDTDHDFEVARELGIEFVFVGHGHQCPTRLAALAAAE